MHRKTLMIRHPFMVLALAAAAGLLLSACDGSGGAAGPESPLPALQKWTFSGKEIAYKSGIAVRGRDLEGKPTAGVTVWLTDQAIDCSANDGHLPIMQGGWVGIKFPDAGLGKRPVRVVVGYWSWGEGLNGNIDDQGSATLAAADTSAGKTVAGSLDFHSEELDPEDGFGKADVKGSFSVSFCP